MTSHSKSGLSKVKREQILRDLGFTFLREGKGDHAIWEHAELRALAKEHKIECPPNLLSNPGQAPWQQTVPNNPATGTWHSIIKKAEWCQEKVASINGADADAERHRQKKQEFRDALKEICDWKRETKHNLRGGEDVKPAPASYHQLQALKAGL